MTATLTTCDRQCHHLADLFYSGVGWDALTAVERDSFARHVDHLDRQTAPDLTDTAE